MTVDLSILFTWFIILIKFLNLLIISRKTAVKEITAYAVVIVFGVIGIANRKV